MLECECDGLVFPWPSLAFVKAMIIVPIFNALSEYKSKNLIYHESDTGTYFPAKTHPFGYVGISKTDFCLRSDHFLGLVSFFFLACFLRAIPAGFKTVGDEFRIRSRPLQKEIAPNCCPKCCNILAILGFDKIDQSVIQKYHLIRVGPRGTDHL